MFCKMDVDDSFLVETVDYRRRGCRCEVDPTPPERDSGCACPKCGSVCVECPGFGFVAPPARSFAQIITFVRSQIRRRVRVRGTPPGFVRLTAQEITVIETKIVNESSGHWSREVVELGPPLRIFDVPVVRDRRKVAIAITR